MDELNQKFEQRLERLDDSVDTLRKDLISEQE